MGKRADPRHEAPWRRLVEAMLAPERGERVRCRVEAKHDGGRIARQDIDGHKNHCSSGKEACREPRKTHKPAAQTRREAVYFHDSSASGLAGRGQLVHMPVRGALVTVTLGSRNRKTLTASSASRFCARP